MKGIIATDVVPVSTCLTLGTWLDAMPHLADLVAHAEHVADVIDEAGEWIEEDE